MSPSRLHQYRHHHHHHRRDYEFGEDEEEVGSRRRSRAPPHPRHESPAFTFETMQKLFDLKMRAKASQSVTLFPASPTSSSGMRGDMGHDPRSPSSVQRMGANEMSSAVAASVATGSLGGPGNAGSCYAKPSLLQLPCTTSSESSASSLCNLLLPRNFCSPFPHGLMSHQLVLVSVCLCKAGQLEHRCLPRVS